MLWKEKEFILVLIISGLLMQQVKGAEIPVKLPANPSSDLPADLSTDLPTELPADLAAGLPVNLPADLPADLPPDLPTDFPTDLPADLPANLPADPPADLHADLPSGLSTDLSSDPPAECSTSPDLESETLEPIVRQTQNTFVEWVLSLVPQRPLQANATLATLTTTETSTDSGTTETIITTVAPSQSPVISVSSSTAPSTATAEPIATATATATATASTSTASSVTSNTTPTSAPSTISTTTMQPLQPILNPARNCSDCVCGITNTQKRIVGGQETEVHQYPWMAMLLYGGRFYCAGTLINDQFVITASHCVYRFRQDRISVRLLEHDRSMSHFQKIDRRVAEIITHPLYNTRTYDNDIAIIRLDEPVEVTDMLRPVCMPTPGKSFKTEIGIVTGWGALKVGGPTSETLQEVQVPIMSQEECRKSRYGPSRITDNMLCAGFEEGKKDSCQGDSGGPLHVVASDAREHQLAGVVSWGEGCAKAGYPGVYTRVNRYGTWIKTKTKDACLCHSEVKKIKK